MTPPDDVGSSKGRIAITMGDPGGIGPEIAVKALWNDEVHELCDPLVIGDRSVLRKAASLLGLEGAAPTERNVLDLDVLHEKDHVWGTATAAGGRAGAAYVEHAVQLALAGEVTGIVTGPLNKEALHQAGIPFPGHTEMLASLTGTRDFAMMLVGPDLHVIHVSTHVSLRDAIERVRQERVGTVIRLAHDALRGEGNDAPRIAVAGLNPHAGEGGMFGHEEIEEIAPAIETARKSGIDASGPHPPDTVFWHAVHDRFDAVVAMYHDQGHIPAKLSGFDRSVNVTVGLPIVRASVDHGTAYDIAGTGVASAASLIEAIRYAGRAARAKVG